MLRALRVRVQNFRNIDDSGWVPLERVTALVGRNESGKTTLLKALHKFNPATPEPYNPQREFPRHRYTRDFENAADWPVCSVVFDLADFFGTAIPALADEERAPKTATCTRYYDGTLEVEFTPEIPDDNLSPAPLVAALSTFASAARRLEAPDADQDGETQALRTALAAWATEWQKKLNAHDDLRGEGGARLLSEVRASSEEYARPQTADMLEVLQGVIAPLEETAQKPRLVAQATALVTESMPVFIYFENYGILDSAIYLPRFLEDLTRVPADARIRTINAMFTHVKLAAKEIAELGRERARDEGATPEVIAQDRQRKEARAIKLNSASLDISSRFNGWYGQRRHTINYQADGDYFRIWVADERRPGVQIELEERSKGFQWFLSFYLLFLVESREGHRRAILLLDEPGLHLHPTAQQELIAFFERLSEENQLLYTTHSPFLIDGEHIHRVRPVTEDETGCSRISVETWPRDRETIFPLQAAAGYAMLRGLFRHRDNVLVEGMSDYYYLHALRAQCLATGRPTLSEDTYIIPCGGTKYVGHLASLFLGQEVRPLVLLDGDDAGWARRDALMKELYAAHAMAILMLDDVLGRGGSETEIEDVVGEQTFLSGVGAIVGQQIGLTGADRAGGSLPSQIKHWARRCEIELPDGWKATTAMHLVSNWAERGTRLPDDVLDRSARLFAVIREHFGLMK